MYDKERVEKPILRSDLRRFIGKEYFVLKRKLKWFFGKTKFSKVNPEIKYENSYIKHRSFLLRPLKDVEMYLQYNKVTNLKIAINKLDKAVIKPGETFSIWKLIGKPTKNKGYLDGLVLRNGKTEKGIGGGLCQLGNLIYWMALHTPLTIKERWRHSYDVFPDVNRTIPFACGATLSYNYIDLQLENTTENNFQIRLWLDDEYLNGEITCEKSSQHIYEIIETDHCFKHQWWGGYTRHNKIWKKITSLNDLIVKEELVAENNAIMMYNPLLNQ